MHPNSKILHIVGLSDLFLALAISCYVGFQIRLGADLIPGGQLTRKEKIARLVVYSSLLYVFLFIQLYMAIQLLKTTKWIIEEPLKSWRKIGTWLEWSFVYLLFIAIHGTTALLLMESGQRKSIILAINSVQVIFRIVAIILTTKYQFLLPNPIFVSKV